jgi:4-diphosphocytidyl-2-C-methyl-D-erythritol kinase
MIVFPHCKINIGLKVLEKRPDGFHDISSVFYPVQLTDILEIIIADDGKFEFSLSGQDLEGHVEENLCVKAFRLLENINKISPVKIHLHKRIPAGAGLGGGSSNAAYTLKVINELFNLELNNARLKEFALELGSDCPFFIEDLPKMVSGRGEIFTDIILPLEGHQLVLVYPKIKISTGDAYNNLDRYNWVQTIDQIISTPVSEWKHVLKNDFEQYVFKTFPIIGEIKSMLYENGALYASLTGSGSAVYGIFERNANFKCKFHDFFVWKQTL